MSSIDKNYLKNHHSENYKALLLRWAEIFSIQSRWVESMPIITAAAAKSLQSCPTLCDPIDGSPPGCPVPGILQASLQHRTLLLSPVTSTSGCCFCFGSISSFGESNGTPLQYPCLENPMDGGAWWAAVHDVTKSWT